jgi:heat shock protein HslJ
MKMNRIFARAFGTLLVMALAGACAVVAPPAEAPSPPAPPLPLRAGGNEPGWNLEIGETVLKLTLDYGQTTVTMPAPRPDATPGVTRYAGSDKGRPLAVTVTDKICPDTMTGMPRPYTVRVVFAGRTLTGCGGEAVALLRGPEWVVEDIDGKGIVDRSRATLSFGADARVTGNASCNTYSAGYRLSGEGLEISAAAVTMKACVPALGNQERSFLGILQAVIRFEIRPDGALVLHTADGRKLRARRG